MKKIYFVKWWAVALCLLLLIPTFLSAQIYSTTIGGPWSDPYTWVGYMIPTAGDDVVIVGPVSASNNACNNLTIESGGSLQNDYYAYSLTVHGNIINNGLIKNNASGYLFTLYVFGDITNNGDWIHSYTIFSGAAEQTISCENGETFANTSMTSEKTGGKFIFNDEATFSNVNVYFENIPAEINNNSTVFFDGGNVEDAIFTGLGTNSKIYGLSNFVNFRDSSFENILFYENINIDDCYFYGENTNYGIFQNAYYSHTAYIYGDFTNVGTIRNHNTSGYLFYLNVYGNITNLGVMSNNSLTFYGDTDQEIYLGEGQDINCTNTISQKTGGAINALTDLTFLNSNIDMNGLTVFFQNNGTLYLNGGYLWDADVIAYDAKSGLMTVNMANGAYAQNCTFTNPTFEGTTNIKNVSCYGNTVNNGVIQNQYYTENLFFYGNITNNGTIRNHPTSGYLLYIDITGNIINNGTWNNYEIELIGDARQYYTQLNNSVISTYQFISNKAIENLEALTDVYFENCIIEFNDDTLVMQENGLFSIIGGHLQNAVLHTTDQNNGILNVYVDGDAYLQSCVVYNPVLTGDVDIINDTFIGEIVNNGFIQNQWHNYTLTIEGNVTNNGTIRNHPSSGYPFAVLISEDILNNGVWSNYNIDINGDEDQNIECIGGNTFSGYEINNIKAAGTTYFNNEVRFENVHLNFNNKPCVLSANSLFYIHNGYLYQTALQGGGETSVFQGVGVHNADAPFIQNVSLSDVNLSGIIEFKNACSLNGTIISHAELRNEYSTCTLDIYDDFTNNGTIGNHLYSGYPFTTNIYGNHTNNGTWDCNGFYFTGTGTQTMSLGVGHSYATAIFNSSKPDGSIVCSTDLSFVNSQIDFNNDTLVIPGGASLDISGGFMQDAIIIPDDNEYGSFIFNMTEGTYLQNSELYSPELSGSVLLRNNSLFGHVVNSGIMENQWSGYVVDIIGSFTNNGTVRNNLYSGYTFQLNITGNFYNNGPASCTHIYMNGTEDQYICIQDENYISSAMHFISDIAVSPYQWYFNYAPLTDPENLFTGENSSTLNFNYAVTEDYYGNYFCSTGGGNSRNLIVQGMSSSKELRITAFLEGPFNGTTMDPDLNDVLPLSQPYNMYPWEYDGIEEVENIPNTDVVDWILVEYRDAPDIESATFETSLGGQAAFILADGSVVDLDGSSPLGFDYSLNDDLFVVLWHRNHLPIASAEPLNLVGLEYSYDFSTGVGQSYGDNQAEIGGYAAMFAGDANADGIINESDLTGTWLGVAGTHGYLQGDLNMDEQADNKDKNDTWHPNMGERTVLPGVVIWSCGDPLLDERDAKEYATVQIGDQCWMAENLNIGSMITGSIDQTNNAVIEKYCYGNDPGNCDVYGGLYQWDEMMQYLTTEGVQGICPVDWHVPTDAEWCVLEQEVDPSISCGSTDWRGNDGGGKLKEAGTAHWLNPNTGATNSSGFTGLPAGLRYYDGIYISINYSGYFWSSSISGPQAWMRSLSYSSAQAYRSVNIQLYGSSVRCIKDE